jgi:ATP-dependent RNA helicase RhlE
MILTQTFSDFGLPAPLLSALDKAGFTTPTAIQGKAIKPQLEGRDIIGIAQTGSGKTAAFGLPILAGLAALSGRPTPLTTRALILAPTRELAVQIDEVLHSLSGKKLQTVLVLGGTSRSAQINKIARGVDVVVATPGRLKDLIDDRKIKLNETRWLVLDEADRMLDMGFIGAVKQIAASIGPRRQTAMFSATMSDEISHLAKGLLNNPVRIEASAPATTVVKIEQKVILAGTKQKRDELNTLLKDPALERVIIFSRTKHGADKVAKNLSIDGHEAAAIHGNKSQNARQAALKAFSSGKARILVATDIAARGIDVPNITHVINYELPDDPENYVHRIGRTGRNGASGIAITLMNGDERGKLRDVERLIRRTLPVTGELKAVPGGEGTAPAAHRPRGARPTGAPGKGRRPGGQRTGQRPDGQRPEGQRGPRPRTDGWLPEGKTEGARAGGKPAGARRPHGPATKAGPGGKPKQRWSGPQKRAAKAKRGEAPGGAVRFGA